MFRPGCSLPGSGSLLAQGSQSPRFGSRCFVDPVELAQAKAKARKARSQSPRFGSRCFVLAAARWLPLLGLPREAERRNPLGSGLGVSSRPPTFAGGWRTGSTSRNPLGSGLGVSSCQVHLAVPLLVAFWVCRNPLGSGLGVSSPLRDRPVCLTDVPPQSQSPRFGSRCFVTTGGWARRCGSSSMARRNPLGSGLGVSSSCGRAAPPPNFLESRNPLGSGLGVSSRRSPCRL